MRRPFMELINTSRNARTINIQNCRPQLLLCRPKRRFGMHKLSFYHSWNISMGAGREQYLSLMWRYFQCGKNRLKHNINVIDDLFSIAKSANRQRKIWNWSFISICEELFFSTSLVYRPQLIYGFGCWNWQRGFYMSKRDEYIWFDVLAAPE